MASVCLYFQIHQPFRIIPMSFFDIGQVSSYENEQENLAILNRIANNCYLPTNSLLLSLINATDKKFKVSFSISGTAIAQFEKYRPDVIASFQALSATGCVEFLAETYYHTLSANYAPSQFKEEVRQHSQKIYELFNQKPKIFRNTELIYDNNIAKTIENLGFSGILCEGLDNILGDRSPNFLYKPAKNAQIKCLLRNYRLSDDIAFRFSDTNWSQFPLEAGKYVGWLENIGADAEVINLFMDYETFGEHQTKSTGIFEFMNAFIRQVHDAEVLDFATASEVIHRHEAKGIYEVKSTSSWADKERDLSAWAGNELQKDSLRRIYEIGKKIELLGNKELIETWSRLKSSDHFYYMSTKNWPDDMVHQYFSPFENPYDAYICYTNVLKDLELYVDYNLELKKMSDAHTVAKNIALNNIKI